MAFRVIDQIWDPNTPANADWAIMADDVVLLLDGAAPVAPERVSTADNDTVWLVRRFAELFREQREVSTLAPMPELAEATRLALRREYDQLCRAAGFVPDETPFACLTIAHDAGGRLELYNMGDQTTLLRGHDGSIRKLGESAVRELDRQALELLVRELAAGVEPHAARHARIRPSILANRAQRNRLQGYDVLDVNVSCQARFEHLSCASEDARDVLLMSDGFYRLVDTFGRYTDQTLFAAIEQVGLASLLSELRAIEGEDADCSRHPRFKRHDDATALWIAPA